MRDAVGNVVFRICLSGLKVIHQGFAMVGEVLRLKEFPTSAVRDRLEAFQLNFLFVFFLFLFAPFWLFFSSFSFSSFFWGGVWASRVKRAKKQRKTKQNPAKSVRQSKPDTRAIFVFYASFAIVVDTATRMWRQIWRKKACGPDCVFQLG